MSNQYYVDTAPLGPGTRVVKTSGFYARAVALPEDVAEALIKQFNDFYLVQSWMDEVYQRASRKDYVPEVPEQIKEILECRKEAKPVRKPRKKASAAASSKGSQKPSKKMASPLSTNPETE